MIPNKKIFYIDSRSRLSGTDSDFSYYLDLGVNNFDSVCVLQANIPKSYYLVQAGQNIFQLREGISTVTITVPIGNYSRTSIKNRVEILLNLNSPNGYTYQITTPTTTQDPETGKYTFIVTGNGETQPQLIFGTSFFEILGFAENSINSFVGNQIISTNVIKLQIEDSLYIHSDLVTNGNDNILQEIFASGSADFTNIIFMNPDTGLYSKNLASNTSNVYRFYLTNEEDLPIDLNGINCVFTIAMFKRENIFELIKQFLKVKLLE